jgi:hypothetical protein
MIPKIDNENEKHSFGTGIIIGLLLFLRYQLEVFRVVHPKHNVFFVVGNGANVVVQHVALNFFLIGCGEAENICSIQARERR